MQENEKHTEIVKLAHRHDIVCYHIASGLTQKETAEKVGYSKTQINNLLKDPTIQYRIDEIKHQLYGRDPMLKFKNLQKDAFVALEDILTRPSVKDSVRLKAAQQVFDRNLGKPTQVIETRDKTVKDIYRILDQVSKLGNASAEPIETVGEIVEDAEIVEPQKELTDDDREEINSSELEEVDKWFNEQYGD